MRRVIHWVDGRLRYSGWPPYDCELCVGQHPGQGCYCAYMGAFAPCDPVGSPWSAVFRWMHGFLFFNTSPYWEAWDKA